MEFTPEQRSAWAYAGEHQMQSQAPGSFHDPDANKARANTWHEQRRADPAKDRAWRGKLIVAKRRKIDPGKPCVVCGAVFCTVNARGIKQTSPRRTCGAPECKSEIKRRAQAKSAQARREQREKAADTLKVLATRTVKVKSAKRP